MAILKNKNNIDQYIMEKKKAQGLEEEIINKRRLLIREQQKKEIIIKNDTPDINKIHVFNGVLVFPDYIDEVEKFKNKSREEIIEINNPKIIFPVNYIRLHELKNCFD